MSAMPERILIVRHGQSVWNKTRRVSGQLDPPLSDTGRAQAQRLAQVLADVPLTAVYASTLQRALDTALPAADRHGLAVDACAELREQHLGVVQGRFRDERDPQAQALWRRREADRLNFRIPGGETHRELQERVRARLERILRERAGGSVLVVGHRNTNRVLLGALLDWTTEAMLATPVRASRLYEITPGKPTPVRTISLDLEDLGAARAGFWT